MEVLSTNQTLNATINRNSANSDSAEGGLNAFGIGQANRPEVELSPQARILQQNEQLENERRDALERQQQNNQEETPDTRTDSFVRVSSSVGTSQRNSLTNEQATELYRAIEKLL